MPYEWIETTPGPARLHLWPYRSLPRTGFVIFIGTTATLLLLPLIAVLGTPVLWGLLPFIVAAIWLLYYFLQRSYRDGELLEELTLSEDRVDLVRTERRGIRREWSAHPYWVEARLHEKKGPVPNYVTLSGGGREVEIGAFLSAEERLSLYGDLSRRLPARP
ncbi:DUF2244 domain-containing protein [Tropicimonas sp. IMCC34011]|uniref:DUF2244 domain-containing protein n=1 Tax=Tropicimonas sp. IMCC34011 TaxID=2248759 RepID=UPI000E27B20A|nr:DUF2244 domain-containing protein [Tropicimonas sp. IMCC34011]